MTTTTKTAGGEGQSAQKCVVQLYNRNVLATTKIFNGRFLCVYKPFVSCDESSESIYFPAAR